VAAGQREHPGALVKQPQEMTPLQIRSLLDETLATMWEANELIGQHVPSAARIWAETHNIPVRESRFCPPNRLFLVGPIIVPDVFVP